METSNSESEKEDENDSSYKEDQSDTDNLLNALNYDIELDMKIWEKIKPVKKKYKDNRIYEYLGKGWTDALSLKMWKASKSQCCFKFRKHNVYRRKNMPYFDFHGWCTDPDCLAKFSGSCANKPSDSDLCIKIHIKSFDTSKIDHTKSRHLARDRRRKAKESLRNIKARHHLVNEAKQLMDESDPIPALLCKLGVYQKARQEIRDQDLKLEDYPGSPLESLHAIMDDTSYIKMISTHPFIVMYWTDQQIKLWNEASKLDEVDISVDASGSFVKKVNLGEDNYSADIFLYIIVVRFSGKIFPVAQMISDSHNTNTISDFIQRTKEDGAPTPCIMVVDCSLALLNGICLPYNGCSYNRYLLNCFKILKGVDANLPPCLVKRDRNHLMKNVTHWKIFEGKDWRIKDFYSRCIAYALGVDNLQLLEYVLSSILIVAQSDCFTTNACRVRYDWLTGKIASFKYENLYEESILGENQYHNIQIIETEDFHEMPNEILNYLYEINRSCQLECSSTNVENFPKPNFLEFPAIVDNIISLFSQFPSWTNVMHPFYPTAKRVISSTGSECCYRLLRNEFGMEHPVSANRFVLNHLNIINGDTLIGRGMLKGNSAAHENSPVKESEIIKKSNIVKKVGIEKKTKIVTKLGLLNLDPVNQNKVLKYRNVIINGLKLPHITVNNREYKFEMTCPFDCNAELLVESYAIGKFKDDVDEFLENNENAFLQLIREYNAESRYALEPLYAGRAQILFGIVPSSSIKIDVVNCEMNVTTLFEKLMKPFSYTLGIVSCNDCDYRKELHYQTKVLENFNLIDSNTFTNLLISLFSPEKYKCRKCFNPNANLDYKLGSYIALDVENLFEDAFANRKTVPTYEITRSVKHLPAQVKLQDKTYNLIGVVGFVPVTNKKGSHYVTYVRKPTYWEKRDDLNANVDHIPLENLHIFVALIIYVQSS